MNPVIVIWGWACSRRSTSLDEILKAAMNAMPLPGNSGLPPARFSKNMTDLTGNMIWKLIMVPGRVPVFLNLAGSGHALKWPADKK